MWPHTTLEGPWPPYMIQKCLEQPLDSSFVVSQFHGHGSWLVCEVTLNQLSSFPYHSLLRFSPIQWMHLDSIRILLLVPLSSHIVEVQTSAKSLCLRFGPHGMFKLHTFGHGSREFLNFHWLRVLSHVHAPGRALIHVFSNPSATEGYLSWGYLSKKLEFFAPY